MCDLNPEKLEAEELMKQKEKKQFANNSCMKCKQEKPVVVIRVHDPLCRNCFLTYVTHKFRSTLGKSKLVQANDKVLLALSGGHSSTALLHLVKEALSLGAHKRLKFSPAVVCVDESETLPPAEGQDYSHIKELLQTLGYPFFLCPIYQGFDDGNASSSCGNDRQRFIECFTAISSLTAKQDFLVNQRTWVITRLALLHGYSKIMFGDNATSLAMKLISNISLGRGETIPHDVGVYDKRFPALTIVRPMREISSKEVALYNRLYDNDVQLPYNLVTMKQPGSSLQQKTEEFINGLVTDFPHTVNTVFRTGEKICGTKCGAEVDQSVCPMCQSSVKRMKSPPEKEKEKGDDKGGGCDSGGGGCDSGGGGCDSGGGGCGSDGGCGSGGGDCGSGGCGSSGFKVTTADLSGQLCYACRLTFNDMGYNVDVLPKHIFDHVTNEVKRMKMKESIQDFLLEE